MHGLNIFLTCQPHAVAPQFKDELLEIQNKVKLLEQNVTFSELVFEISVKEVHKAYSKLQSGRVRD